MVSQKVLKHLFAAFPNAIINCNLEFIADPHPRVGSCFRLEDCETEEDAAAKVLEWLSRDAYKSLHFNYLAINRRVWDYHRNGINTFCRTNFTHEDMEKIYTHLGNCCNHAKTLAFIRSGYDMSLLAKEGS